MSSPFQTLSSNRFINNLPLKVFDYCAFANIKENWIPNMKNASLLGMPLTKITSVILQLHKKLHISMDATPLEHNSFYIKTHIQGKNSTQTKYQFWATLVGTTRHDSEMLPTCLPKLEVLICKKVM